MPANKPQFLKKSSELKNIDFRIFDFEDSVYSHDIDNAILLLKKFELKSSDWVRIPTNKNFLVIAKQLLDIGLTNVVLPKIIDIKQFENLFILLKKLSQNVRIIVLIENALIYLQIESILNEWNKHIYGIGFGSHDFSAVTNIRHNTKELFPLRLQISLLANAYGVIPIDIASMNISDTKGYQTEIQSAYDLGYRAKFVLHPFQLQLINEYQFYSIDEVEDATKILDKFNQSEQKNEIVLKFKGKIYEKPHVDNLRNIKAWGEQYYGTDR